MSYQYRKAQHDKKQEQINRNARVRRQHATALKVNALISNFQAAYKAVHGANVRVDHLNSWYEADGFSPVREADFVRRTNTLWAKAHEKELDAPEENA